MACSILTILLLMMVALRVKGLHISPSSAITVSSARQVNLTCLLGEESEDAHNAEFVRWSGPAFARDNVEIETDDEISATSMLQINNIDEYDEGVYTCLYDGLLASVTVIVYQRSYFGHVLESQEFVQGVDARIFCPAFLGDPPGIMLWYHNGSLINANSDSRYVFHENALNQALEIRNIQIDDLGVYHCRIFSDVFSTILRDIMVNVLPLVPRAPSIDKSNRTHTFWYLDDLELTCNVVSGDEPITYEWSINGVVQQDSNTSTLYRQGNTYEGGEYRCTVRNKVGENDFFIDVKVDAPPLPTTYFTVRSVSMSHVSHNQGITVILRYKVPTTPVEIAQLNIHWSKLVNGREFPVKFGSRIRLSFQRFLIIEDLRLSDAGTYLVNISNQFGASLQTIVLSFHYSAPCKYGDIILFGGSNRQEGRVEVCFGSQWSTMCNVFWDEVNAGVACRQAGFSYEGAIPVTNVQSVFVTEDYHIFGQPLLLICNGSEQTLTDCTTVDPGIRHCMNAGVRCSNTTTVSNPKPQNLSVFFELTASVTTTVSVLTTEFVHLSNPTGLVSFPFSTVSTTASDPRPVRMSVSTTASNPGPVQLPNPSVTTTVSNRRSVHMSNKSARVYIISIGVVPGSLVVIIVVLLFMILAVILRKKRVLIQRQLKHSQEHIYDEILAGPPLPPVRAQQVETEQNIAYESADGAATHCVDGVNNNSHCLTNNNLDPHFEVASESGSEVQPSLSIIICEENEAVNNISESLQDPLNATNESSHLKQAGTDDPLAEVYEYEQSSVVVNEPRSNLKENIVLHHEKCHHEYDQIQQYELIGGYETIGGYERAPNVDLFEFSSNPRAIPCNQIKDTDDDIDDTESQNPHSVHSRQDYDQIQPYELVPRLHDSDIENIVAQFNRHTES